MFGTAYLIENLEHIESIVNSLSSVIDDETVAKQLVQDRIQSIFSPSLKYMDTHRNRQVVKGLIIELTNISFVTKLQNIQSRKGTRNASNTLPNPECYDDIRKTSQIVRNDLTNAQQYKLMERFISSRKLKEIRTTSEGSGRKLKSQEYPELAAVLSYAFGEHDLKEYSGGGLEAHPRLTTGTLYRASDNATAMKKAREFLLSLAPEGFSISLSSCFNYTQNFQQNSGQAKRHHSGRGINTLLSLKKPPRTGVQQLVINLHWSTANVNLLIDNAHDKPECVTISKDAKAIVSCDIAPVQRPGPSWKRRLVLPDHTCHGINHGSMRLLQ